MYNVETEPPPCHIEVYRNGKLIKLSNTEHTYDPPEGLGRGVILGGLKQIIEAAVAEVDRNVTRIKKKATERVNLLATHYVAGPPAG